MFKKLSEYLQANGYEVASLERLKTYSGTSSFHFKLFTKTGSLFFIKIGEHVGRDVNNRAFLYSAGVSVDPPRKGSSFENDILIIPWIDGFDAGYEMVRDLHKGTVDAKTFVEFQELVFRELFKLIEVTVDTPVRNYPQSIPERAHSFVSSVPRTRYTDIDLKFLYHFNNQRYILPSVRTVLERIISTAHSNGETSWVHGDFYPTNVGVHDGRPVISDFSDVAFCDSLVWDFAKWTNYVKRFYTVLPIRAGELKTIISLSSDDKMVEIFDTRIFSDSYFRTRAYVDQSVARLCKEREIKLSDIHCTEVLVNIFTIPRHFRLFPSAFPEVLANLCQSMLYADL